MANISVSYGIICILIMAGITYLLRMLPITLMERKIKSPYLNAFLSYIPFTILGALTFPDVFLATGFVWSAIAGTIVAVTLAYFKRGLVEIALAAIVIVYVVEILM